jgi:hypothetical protein
VLALLGVLALPGVHWRLIGWAKGEPFYQGRPASYWASECQHYIVIGTWEAGATRRYTYRIEGPKFLWWVKWRLGYKPSFRKIAAVDEPFAQADSTAVPFLKALCFYPGCRASDSWAAQALSRIDSDAVKEAADHP